MHVCLHSYRGVTHPYTRRTDVRSSYACLSSQLQRGSLLYLLSALLWRNCILSLPSQCLTGRVVNKFWSISVKITVSMLFNLYCPHLKIKPVSDTIFQNLHWVISMIKNVTLLKQGFKCQGWHLNSQHSQGWPLTSNPLAPPPNPTRPRFLILFQQS